MKIGDTVSVLDEDLSGVVISIESDTILIETNDGFEMKFTKSELVTTDSAFSKELKQPLDMSKILSEKEGKNKKKLTRTKPKERARASMVVDLHIDKLITSEKGMDAFDKLTLQVDTAKRQLDFAIWKKMPRIVFVHGIGEGVLRAELETLFRRYDNIRYEDANYKEYGRGATEVFIQQNSTS